MPDYKIAVLRGKNRTAENEPSVLLSSHSKTENASPPQQKPSAQHVDGVSLPRPLRLEILCADASTNTVATVAASNGALHDAVQASRADSGTTFLEKRKPEKRYERTPCQQPGTSQ